MDGSFLYPDNEKNTTFKNVYKSKTNHENQPINYSINLSIGYAYYTYNREFIDFINLANRTHLGIGFNFNTWCIDYGFNPMTNETKYDIKYEDQPLNKGTNFHAYTNLISIGKAIEFNRGFVIKPLVGLEYRFFSDATKLNKREVENYEPLLRNFGHSYLPFVGVSFLKFYATKFTKEHLFVDLMCRYHFEKQVNFYDVTISGSYLSVGLNIGSLVRLNKSNKQLN